MKINIDKPTVIMLNTSVFDDEEKFNQAYADVSVERKKKIDFYRFKKDKKLSLAAGVLLEQGLKNLGIEKYSLRYGEYQKPYIEGYDNVFFNLSHSEDYSVCVFYKKETGIDIEKIADVSEDVIKEVTTGKEYKFLTGLDEETKKEQFYRLWSVKESYMKYLGRGLSVHPGEIEMTFNDDIEIVHNGKIAPVILQECKIDGYKMTVCYDAY